MEQPKKNIESYLRMHRRMWGFTQDELAILMGFSGREHVSRIENGERTITIDTALACEVIFGTAPSAMFPAAYGVIEERIIRHVYEMHESLTHKISLSAARKRELLANALARAINKPKMF